MAIQQPSRRIPLGSDWEIEVELTINGAVLAGGTVVRGFISETRDGAAINPALEVALVRAADQKTWRGVIPAAAVDAHLAALVDQRVWERIVVEGTALNTTRWVFVRDILEL